jgi:bifunctional NMN adenylyltransferase/nudix hydrolase
MKKADVGILVGRFQVPQLTQGHIDLIQQVVENHSKTIIFLGLSPLKCSLRNPLDFETRKQLILDKFPSVHGLIPLMQ